MPLSVWSRENELRRRYQVTGLLLDSKYIAVCHYATVGLYGTRLRRDRGYICFPNGVMIVLLLDDIVSEFSLSPICLSRWRIVSCVTS